MSGSGASSESGSDGSISFTSASNVSISDASGPSSPSSGAPLTFLPAKDAPYGPKTDTTGSTNYVRDGSTLNSSIKHKMRVGLIYKNPSKANQNVGAPKSTRNAGGKTIDEFDPASIDLDENGEAKFTLKTDEDLGDLKVKLDGAETEVHQMLPAVFKDKFFCTVYYTPLESGFTSEATEEVSIKYKEGGSTEEGVLILNSVFWEVVKTEGWGKLATAAHGYEYIDYNGWLGSQPVGKANRPLVPKKSCAGWNKQFFVNSKRCSKVTIDNVAVSGPFGNSDWDVVDVGGAVGKNHLDLYWGEANPRGQGANERFLPAGTTFTRANDIYVVLKTI